MLIGEYGKYAIKRQQQQGEKEEKKKKEPKQRQHKWYEPVNVGLEMCVNFARRNAWIIFAFVKSKHNGEGTVGGRGVRGQREGLLLGCVPRICAIQTELALLLLLRSLLTYPGQETKEHATYLQNICHIQQNGKQKISQNKHSLTVGPSLPLSFFLSLSTSLAHTHVLFKS